MRWRLIAIITAVFIVASGAGAASTLVLPPVTEQLVEGHTVFTVIQNIPPTGPEEEEYAAAVAVLVREVSTEVSASRFAGVLWFNDQYLVNPTGSENKGTPKERYPCTGAVLATPAGSGDPRIGAENFTQDKYVESYYITDPNEQAWIIDKWNVSGTFVWTVPLMNDDTGYSIRDDGSSCPSKVKSDGSGCAGQAWTLTDRCVSGPAYPGRRQADPGDHGYSYPCGGQGSGTCSAIKYNALLYFLLADLTPSGIKDHTIGSADYTADVSGCHYGTYTGQAASNWPCPGADDDREGNSHPYNPKAPEPFQRSVRAPHGGSADCDGDGVGDDDCHATVDIEIYYDVAALPTRGEYRVFDAQGYVAPYHCHEGQNGFGGQPYC